MRRCDYLIEPQQWIVGGRRLLLKHIERSSSDLPAQNSVYQSALIDQSSASAIDQSDAGLHSVNCSGADQVPSFIGQRSMYRDEVGASDQLIQRDHLDAHLLSGLFCEVWIVC